METLCRRGESGEVDLESGPRCGEGGDGIGLRSHPSTVGHDNLQDRIVARRRRFVRQSEVIDKTITTKDLLRSGVGLFAQ
jgi:hypothetical protein